MNNKCCICTKIIKGIGNNPNGAMWRTTDGEVVSPTFKENDKCCDECNNKYVIVGRLYKMQKKEVC